MYKIDNIEINDEQLDALIAQRDAVTSCVVKLGQDYWYIADTGHVQKSMWSNYLIHPLRLDIGNVYLTKAEATNAANKRRAMATVKQWIAANCREVNENAQVRYYFGDNCGHIFSESRGIRPCGDNPFVTTEADDERVIAACEAELRILAS